MAALAAPPLDATQGIPAALEEDWRKQDGIGTPRRPATFAAAIELTLDRGDRLIRDLQAEGVLRALLAGVRSELDAVAPGRPLLVKIAPDLADAGIDAAVDAALEARLDGLICTNTTIGRGGLSYDAQWVAERGAGGLSGSPVRARSTAVLARVARRLGGRLPIIGVGGVDSAAAAWEKIGHGASLVQVYTGLVMQGPWLVRTIVDGLVERLDRHRLGSIAEAVGRAM